VGFSIATVRVWRSAAQAATTSSGKVALPALTAGCSPPTGSVTLGWGELPDADPAEFNKKVKVFFFSTGTEPPLENPEALKRHQQQLIEAGITNTNSYLYISPGTSHE
jgi:hypothetical protein